MNEILKTVHHSVLKGQGWVPQKAGYLTGPVKNKNSVIMIIIIANNI